MYGEHSMNAKLERALLGAFCRPVAFAGRAGVRRGPRRQSTITARSTSTTSTCSATRRVARRRHCQLNGVEASFPAPLVREGGSPIGVPRTSPHRTTARPTAEAYHPHLIDNAIAAC